MLWRKRCGRIRGRVVQEIATVLGLMYRVTNDFGENVVFLTDKRYEIRSIYESQTESLIISKRFEL